MAGEPRASTFLIALIWVSFIAITLSLFIAGFADNYSGVDYDNKTLANFNKLEALHNTSEQINRDTDIKERTGIDDIIGGYLSAGYQVLKGIGQSIGLFTDLSNEAFNHPSLNIGNLGYLKSAIVTTVIILFAVGILLSALIKWRL